MSYNQYEILLSAPRLAKYKAACAGHEGKALTLYRANIRLSQELYAVIGLFEVVLRNHIDRHFAEKKGGAWLENAVITTLNANVFPCTGPVIHPLVWKKAAKNNTGLQSPDCWRFL